MQKHWELINAGHCGHRTSRRCSGILKAWCGCIWALMHLVGTHDGLSAQLMRNTFHCFRMPFASCPGRSGRILKFTMVVIRPSTFVTTDSLCSQIEVAPHSPCLMETASSVAISLRLARSSCHSSELRPGNFDSAIDRKSVEQVDWSHNRNMDDSILYDFSHIHVSSSGLCFLLIQMKRNTNLK